MGRRDSFFEVGLLPERCLSRTRLLFRISGWQEVTAEFGSGLLQPTAISATPAEQGAIVGPGTACLLFGRGLFRRHRFHLQVLERFPEFASSLREGFESRTFKSSRSSEERRSRRSVAGHLIHEGLTDDNPFVPSFGSAPRLPGVGKWAAYSRRPDTPPSPISRKSSQLS